MTIHQTWSPEEDGFGIVTVRFVMSDTYDGLTEEGVEADLFEVDEVDQNLDVDTGIYAADELSLSILGTAIESDEDQEAYDFALAARDPLVKRYVGVLVNRNTPIQSSDFLFRGVLRPEFEGEDQRWSGAAYSGAITPVRNWKASAVSYEVDEMLGRSIDDIIDGVKQKINGVEQTVFQGISDAWIAANVADRPGYFKRTSGDDYGHREARFAQLVSFEALLQEMLNVAAPDGVTLTYEAADTEFYAYPARYICVTMTDGRKLRYVQEPRNSTTEAPRAHHVLYPDRVRLKAGGSIAAPGAMAVSWKCLKDSNKEAERFSWRGYDTLADLIYALASALDMFVEFEHTSTTAVTIRFNERQTVDKGPVFIRDAEKASISLKPLKVDDEKRKRYVGACWQYSREGAVQYNYDGGFLSAQPTLAAPTEGELIALTVSPGHCFFQNRGEDAGYNLGEEVGWSILPHNAIFYDSATAPKPQGPNGWKEYNLSNLHTGIYITCLGRPDAEGEVGVDGQLVFRPVAILEGNLNSETDWIGEETYSFGLSDHLNKKRQRDANYFSAEYSIDLPFFCCYRTSEAGTDDWRNVKLGSRIALDAVDYLVVGIKWKLRTLSTQLRLHNRSRFVYPLPTPSEPPAPYTFTANDYQKTSVSSAFFSTKSTGEAVGAWEAVTLKADGKVYRSQALNTHRGRVTGITIAAAGNGAPVRVQTSGRVICEGLSLTPGQRVYVRTAAPGVPNISSTPLLESTTTEDTFIDIGFAETESIIVLDQRESFTYYPPLVDEG